MIKKRGMSVYTGSFLLTLGAAIVTTTILFIGDDLSANASNVNHVTKTTLTPIPKIDIPVYAKPPPIDREIVFDSNRSGTFGIYKLDVKTLVIAPIVDSSHHEMYPDPSPDGNFIVYSRAVSTSRLSPSEIWIHDLRTEQSKLLVKDGVAPNFSGDGTTVYFERNRRKVIAVDVAGSNEREIFPLTLKEMKGFQIVKPRISPSGRYLSFTSDKGGAWNAWIADLTDMSLIHIGPGCEPTWRSDSAYLAWIKEAGAKERSGVFSFTLSDRVISEIQDADGPLGHEYFPYISPNERWLLYSAAPPRQHSHIEDNYHLMAKDLSTGEVHQLTFDRFTNRWPKFIAVSN